MYSESDIDAAVAAGALTPQAAEAFRTHVAEMRAAPAVDQESFRFLTGFNDIFVSIAAVLMLVALGWLGNSVRLLAQPDAPSPLAGLAVAAGAWGLAEYFTRQRRMALPSILLLLAFTGGLGLGTMMLLSALLGVVPDGNDRAMALLTSAAAAVTAGGVWLHWRRFQVPITIAAGAATLAALSIGLILAAVPPVVDYLSPLIFLAGIAVFALAMRWDMSDRTRTTRRSDVAFWLHLLAAPMLVHPIFSAFGPRTELGAPVVIALYILLGFVALAIDRRALMVSALAYVLYAIGHLIDQGGSGGGSFGITAFVIGSALLLLSAFWTVARAWVVERLPQTLADRLPMIDRHMAA